MGGQVQAAFPEERDRPAGREEQREKTAQVRLHTPSSRAVHIHTYTLCSYTLF